MSGQFLLLPCFIRMLVINAKSVDLDQTPRSAAEPPQIVGGLRANIQHKDHTSKKECTYILQV